MANQTSTSSYREVKIGNTLYRVTSVFTGEKDLGKTLEQLAVRRAMTELSSCPATSQLHRPCGWPHPCAALAPDVKSQYRSNPMGAIRRTRYEYKSREVK